MKNKGFTLVELLITIALIGVIGTIIVISMVGINRSTKDAEYDRFVDKIISAARTYADINAEAFNDLYIDKAYIYIDINTLIEEGLIDADLKNPYTNERVNRNEKIKVTLDDLTGALKFIYPVSDDDEKEQSLIAISDYVVPGEKFNCEIGLGSYMLSLYDEDGSFIDLSTEEAKNKYNFKCWYKSENNKILEETKPGDYEIEYSWKTLSGTNRRKRRIIKVIAPPTLNMDYNQNYNGKTFTTSYDEGTGKWNYLAFRPKIEGIDYNLLSLSIDVKNGNKTENLIGNSSTNTYLTWDEYLASAKTVHQNLTKSFTNYDNYYNESYLPVYDGDYTYVINILMTGHYDKNYRYNPFGNNSNKNQFKIKESVKIPSSVIINNSIDSKYSDNDYLAKKTFSIDQNKVFTIKGISKFEYTYGDDTKTNKPINFTASSQVLDVLVMEKENTQKTIVTLENIYFRVVDSQNNSGPWSDSRNLKITNDLSKLLKSGEKNIDCTKGAVKNPDNSYYFCGKGDMPKNHIILGTTELVALEIKDNNQIYVTTEGELHGTIRTTTLKNKILLGIYNNSPVNILYARSRFIYRNYPLSKSKYVLNDFPDSNHNNLIIPTLADYQKYAYALSSNNVYYLSTLINSSEYDDYLENGNDLEELEDEPAPDEDNDQEIGYNEQSGDEEITTGEDKGEEKPKSIDYSSPLLVIENDIINDSFSGEFAAIKPIVALKSGLFIVSGDGTIINPYVIG